MILNKLGVLLYNLLAGISNKTELVKAEQGRRKPSFVRGLLSVIFGIIIGALQGVLLTSMFLAPICEIVAAFAI